MSNERYSLRSGSGKKSESAAESTLWVLAAPREAGDWAKVLPSTQPLRKEILALAKKRGVKAEAGALLSFGLEPGREGSIWLVGADSASFALLSAAKGLAQRAKETRTQAVRIELLGLESGLSLQVIDALVSAFRVQEFEAPRYGQPKPDAFVFAPKVEFRSESALPGAAEQIALSLAEADGTNTVRELSMQAGNDLNPKTYIQRLKKEAAAEKLDFKLYTVKDLQKMGAGAFLAVAQGSDHEDAGIVRLTYKPKTKAVKKLVLVGKGVTFDTGGTNLKPAQYMFGMNDDMAGSAIAFALIRIAARLNWPVAIEAYLAISDNAIGPKAYRPNDVVTAMNKKTIEIIHTDAEGRMMLADTLTLASQAKSDLILDFATLTGACVMAIGKSYCGAFTNRSGLHETIRKAGVASGERAWPFPIDEDFGECLKSSIADIKQCRLTGGNDHIEAAIFLKGFLSQDLPWVHLDLSPANRDGGLAHVDTDYTGFGVRLGSRLIRDILL